MLITSGWESGQAQGGVVAGPGRTGRMSACKEREDFRVHCVFHLAPPCICPSPNVHIEAESKRGFCLRTRRRYLGEHTLL